MGSMSRMAAWLRRPPNDQSDAPYIHSANLPPEQPHADVAVLTHSIDIHEGHTIWAPVDRKRKENPGHFPALVSAQATQSAAFRS